MDDITIYAAGEIHSEWREELRTHLDALDVEADVVGPQEAHDRSDSVGEDILGAQPGAMYRDLMGARVNTLRTRVLMQRADLCVAYFGPKYRQWNTGDRCRRGRGARAPARARCVPRSTSTPSRSSTRSPRSPSRRWSRPRRRSPTSSSSRRTRLGSSLPAGAARTHLPRHEAGPDLGGAQAQARHARRRRVRGRRLRGAPGRGPHLRAPRPARLVVPLPPAGESRGLPGRRGARLGLRRHAGGGCPGSRDRLGRPDGSSSGCTARTVGGSRRGGSLPVRGSVAAARTARMHRAWRGWTPG